MSDWEDTPFKSLESARATTEKMDLKPSTIVTDEAKGIRYFQVREGKRRYIMAQKLEGGLVRERRLDKGEKPPPLVDPLAPRFDDEMRFRVGPWCLTRHKTLAECQAHLQKQFVNPDNIQLLPMMLLRLDADEYEYVQDKRGVWVRLLARPTVHTE